MATFTHITINYRITYCLRYKRRHEQDGTKGTSEFKKLNDCSGGWVVNCIRRSEVTRFRIHCWIIRVILLFHSGSIREVELLE